jgi:cytidylate kinase
MRATMNDKQNTQTLDDILNSLSTKKHKTRKSKVKPLHSIDSILSNATYKMSKEDTEKAILDELKKFSSKTNSK